MLLKDRYLVVFSIATSILSASLAFVERFIKSIHEVDLMVIFFAGVFVMIVIFILLFFLARGIVNNIIDLKKKQLRVSLNKKKSSRKKSSKRKR